MGYGVRLVDTQANRIEVTIERNGVGNGAGGTTPDNSTTWAGVKIDASTNNYINVHAPDFATDIPGQPRRAEHPSPTPAA